MTPGERRSGLGDGTGTGGPPEGLRTRPGAKPERNQEPHAERSELLRELEAAAPVGLAVLDSQLRYVRLNETMASIHGLSIEQHLGRRPSEVLQAVGEVIEELARSVLRTGEPILDAELRGARPTAPDRECICRSSYYPLLDKDQQVQGVNVVVQDVTGWRQAEEVLRERDARMAAIVEHAIDGIVTIDQEGAIESFNPAAQRMFGYSAEEAVGRNVAMLMPEALATDHDGFLRRYLETGEARIIGVGREVEGRRKDGSLFPLDLGILEVRHEGRRGFTAFLRDLSERRRLEEEFLQAQKMEAIGRLATGIAHDFNNLLMGVLGCARMAAAHLPPGNPAASLLEEIRSAAESGAGLTRQLLAFGRKRPIHPRPMRVGDVVEGAREMLRQVLGEDIQLAVRVCPSRGPVLADPVQIEQVLLNLVVNSRDAMPHGGDLVIEVAEVPPRPQDLGAHQVVLRVTDTGTGIAPDARPRVFEPFFTTKGPGEGTGLGLSTVYGIVRQLGGSVDFDSVLRRGTTFRVHLPRHDAPVPPAAQTPEAAATAVERAEQVESNGRTVLLVEDERLVRAALRHTLAGLGFQVLTAEDGEQALERCDSHPGPIHLLLTDMVLPGLGGHEIAGAVLARRPGTRVLYMSAHPNETLVDQGRIEPGEISLEKPFSDQDLSAALRRALAETAPA